MPHEALPGGDSTSPCPWKRCTVSAQRAEQWLNTESIVRPSSHSSHDVYFLKPVLCKTTSLKAAERLRRADLCGKEQSRLFAGSTSSISLGTVAQHRFYLRYSQQRTQMKTTSVCNPALAQPTVLLLQPQTSQLTTFFCRGTRYLQSHASETEIFPGGVSWDIMGSLFLQMSTVSNAHVFMSYESHSQTWLKLRPPAINLQCGHGGDTCKLCCEQPVS